MTVGEIWRRVWYLLNRGRHERELAEEMAVHRGMMDDAGRFGNPLKLREDARDAWGWAWLDRAGQDLRGAVRRLRRAPAFTITACAILGAGIGLNLTFFQLLNVTTLQPPAVRDPQTLVRFNRRSPSFYSSGFPYPAAQFIGEHNDVLAAVLTRYRTELAWDDDAATRLKASFVSANWFEEMGYVAAAGRVLDAKLDAKPDAPAVVVVSFRFWRTRLGADAGAIGGAIRLNGRVATIVGVSPERFPDLDLDDPQLWLPIHQVEYFEPGTKLSQEWRSSETELCARLRPGVSVRAASDGLRSTVAALAQAHPADFKPDEWFEAASAAHRFRSDHDRQEIWTVVMQVGGLTLLVLVVAAANLGNLVLSHAMGRVREFSVRVALGATRWRILRQILIECALVAAAGAVAGIVLSQASARVLASFMEWPSYLDFSMDWRLFAAASAVAFVAMLAFGLIPAWVVSRRDLVGGIKDGGEQMSAGLSRGRFRLALVAAQVVGCCALLVVSGAMARGLQKLLSVDPGYTVDGLAVLDPSLARHGIRHEAVRTYWSAVKQMAAAGPEVAGMTLVDPEPLGESISVTGYPDMPPLKITPMHVEPAFFSVFDIPVVAGRTFRQDDDAKAVVIISRRLAGAWYGTIDVVGRSYPPSGNRTIVGVVGDAPLTQLRAQDTAEEYSPLDAARDEGAVLVVRGRSDPGALLPLLRTAARAPDARVLPATHLLASRYQEKLRGPTLASEIAAAVSLLVLALCCLGIFGVVTYAVRVRTKEIGIRRALGASTRGVLAALLRQLAWPIAIGALVGTGLGLEVSRLLSAQEFYFVINDPAAPAVAVVVFGLAALVAAVVPATRALTVDPARALRHE